MNTQKVLLAVVAVAVLIIGAGYLYFSGMLTGVTPEDTNTADAVARVNGEEVSRDALEARRAQMLAQQDIDSSVINAELQSQLDARIVEELVNEALVQQAITASSVTVPQESIDAQVDATISQLGGASAFQEALAVQGISEEDFRTQIRDNLTVQAYLEEELELSSVSATEEEIEAAYAQATEANEEVPPLEDVRAQVVQSVVQQKQQSLIAQLIETLRANAEIEVLL